jgi:hypothetical protein
VPDVVIAGYGPAGGFLFDTTSTVFPASFS